MGQRNSALDAAIASAGAFWANPVGKAVLEFTHPSTGDVGANTGILLAPTPSVWSMWQWRFEALESAPGYQLGSRVYSGFVLFSDDAGDPAARFGTGVGDPGRSGNVAIAKIDTFNYGLTTDIASLPQGGEGNRPIEILSTGEIVLYSRLNSGNTAYIKGVLVVSPEVILPAAP